MTGVVSHAGSVLLTPTADAVGVCDALSTSLAPWREPNTVHHPGTMPLDLAVSVAVGGDCLADIVTPRAEPGLVASDPTGSRLTDTLAAAVDASLAAVNTPRAQIRSRGWRWPGAMHPTTTPNGRW